MSLMLKWGEYVWARLRRMDYWNAAHVPTNASSRVYRTVSPGSQPVASPLRSGEENVYSIRYFHRDYKRRECARGPAP